MCYFMFSGEISNMTSASCIYECALFYVFKGAQSTAASEHFIHRACCDNVSFCAFVVCFSMVCFWVVYFSLLANHIS